MRISASFNTAHLTSDTATHILSGKRNLFVLAYIAAARPSNIQLRPILIANRFGRGQVWPGLGFVETHPARVWPQQVDQFDGVNFGTRLNRRDLEPLREISEEQTRHWFADLLGEAEIPKDWGGEQFDLWTERLTVRGARVDAAIAFKGPAKFRPMTVAELGKNRDQLSRLAQTSASLLVVQHCHAITAQVKHLLHAYANQPHNQRRYMMIDGYDTVRILKHFAYM